MRRDFVANASHELKTPLAGLCLLTDTLDVALGDDPEKALQCVERLRTETQRLTNLTSDLLTLSQLEEPEPSGSTTYGPVDLAALARDAIEEVKPLAESKHQEFDRRSPRRA